MILTIERMSTSSNELAIAQPERPEVCSRTLYSNQIKLISQKHPEDASGVEGFELLDQIQAR
jgi:hypothetical protein